MNYGSPTMWDILQKENISTPDDNLTVIESSQVGKTGVSAGVKSLGPMTPEVAYMGRIAYGIVAPIIITFGIFSNILNLLVLTRPTLRGPTYRYLMWLAVANLLVCVTLLPFILHSHHTPVGYLAALYLAHLEMPFGNALIASSVYIVVGLSIDRYVAVCHPRKYRNLHSHRVASIRIAVSFVIGFVIYIPMSFGKEVVRADDGREQFLSKENFTVTGTKWWIIYKCLLEICARFAPAVLLAFLNIWIIIEFKRVSRRRRLLSHNLVELSGFPSQSQAEVSQGTTQQLNRDEREETCLSQKDESKSISFHCQQKNRKCIKNKFLAVAKCGGIKLPVNSRPMEMANIQTKKDDDDTKMTNGECYPKPSFFSLKRMKSGDITPKSQSSLKFKFSPNINEMELNGKSPNAGGEGDIFSPEKASVKEMNENKQDIATDESPTAQKILYRDDCPSPEIKAVSRNHSRRSCKPMSARRLDMERRLVLLLVVIMIAFFLTNIPTAILSLTFTENKRASLSFQIFRAIANNLEFLNFGLNFILYFLFSQDIRKTFMIIIRRTVRRFFKKLFSSTTTSKIPNNM